MLAAERCFGEGNGAVAVLLEVHDQVAGGVLASQAVDGRQDTFHNPLAADILAWVLQGTLVVALQDILDVVDTLAVENLLAAHMDAWVDNQVEVHHQRMRAVQPHNHKDPQGSELDQKHVLGRSHEHHMGSLELHLPLLVQDLRQARQLLALHNLAAAHTAAVADSKLPRLLHVDCSGRSGQRALAPALANVVPVHVHAPELGLELGLELALELEPAR